MNINFNTPGQSHSADYRSHFDEKPASCKLNPNLPESRVCGNFVYRDSVVSENPFFVGNFEAVGGGQFVVGVKRRGVTSRTALTLEDLLAACSDGVEPVGVGRRLERVDVEGQGVELLVAVASVD